ncbi:hypothetical protein KOSB73_260038 [Klebsiella grimontii]|uniref:Uncharacterized protein n=1 Tax=Klebsiella grimontii TaxID=2058152 RepID=A0A285B2Z1_9ENTR|nr:hypothetical protein KOSB73_260038 [Klebsiella grimontii]
MASEAHAFCQHDCGILLVRSMWRVWYGLAKGMSAHLRLNKPGGGKDKKPARRRAESV